MTSRIAFGILVTAAALAVNALMGCATLKYPSCGNWRDPRPSDGAVCRECFSLKDGHYAECGMRLDRRPP